MRRIIWVVVALAIAGYFVYSYLDNRAEREAERAEAERTEQTIKSAVAAMVSRHGAVDDWERRLSKGERFRLEPILTVELERLWLGGRPILFIGAIKDIATSDDLHYRVLVRRDQLGSCMFGTELELSLRSPNQKIDEFLKAAPNLFGNYGFNNGVAVIARIENIRTIYVPGEEGGHEEVKTGDGQLLDITYTATISFDR